MNYRSIQNHFQNIVNSLSMYPITGAENALSMWIAPHLVVVAEFVLKGDMAFHLKWWEKFVYDEPVELSTNLAQISKKHWLRNRTVSIACVTPDLYSVGKGFNPETPCEEQDLLPAGISWSSIEYSVLRGEKDTFACMQKTSVEMVHTLLDESKLIPLNIVPSGPLWYRIFNKENVECNLPEGKLKYSPDKDALYIPNDTIENDQLNTARFNCGPNESFLNIPAEVLPALEPILIRKESPQFNLNYNSYSSEKQNNIEQFIWRFMKYSSAGTVGVAAVLFLLFILAIFAEKAVGNKRKTIVTQQKSIKETQAYNTDAIQRINEFKDILAKKSSVTRYLYDIGKLAGDSLWYSEIKEDITDGCNIVLIGHALSEIRVPQFINDLNKVPGINNIRLEYTEKLSAKQVGRLTKWRKNRPLYRFKVACGFKS